jgi:hypothetical protein
MILRPDNADAEVTEGELAPLLDLARVVEANCLAAVDECYSARPHDLAHVTTYDQRGVFIHAQA